MVDLNALRIIRRVDGDRLAEFYLKIDGAFIDLYPLWRAIGAKKLGKFMGLSEFRRRYLVAVEAEIGEPAIRAVAKAHGSSRANPDNVKRYWFHQLLIKPALYGASIDALLEYEPVVARAWGLSELPMLAAHQFDCARHRGVYIVRRRCDSWINLTECLRGTGANAAALAKSHTMLMRRLDAATPSEPKDGMVVRYVDTDYTGSETWVEPNIFMASLMDYDADFHREVTRAMLDMMFARPAARESRIISAEMAAIAKPRAAAVLARLFKTA